MAMKQEIKALTGLRGVAAFTVMLYHFLKGDTYFAAVQPNLVQRGYLSVDIFFILSGFVMAFSYAPYFRESISWANYRLFMGKRLARVYPLYIVITLIFTLKYALNFSGSGARDFHLPDFIACALMVQGWGFDFANVAGATWSLSTEVFAYLVFPGLVCVAMFARPVYAALLTAGACGVLGLIVLSGLGTAGALDVFEAGSLLPLLRCLAGFSLGLVIYRLSLLARCRALFSAGATLAVLLAGLLLAAHLRAPDLVLYALFPPLVLALYYDGKLARLLFGNGLIYQLGVISYSLYLVHPLFAVLQARGEPMAERWLGPDARPLVLLVTILLTCGLAWLFYRLVEMPGRLYVQRFLLRSRLPQPGAP